MTGTFMDEFLYLCECVGYRVKVESEKLNAFILVQEIG